MNTGWIKVLLLSNPWPTRRVGSRWRIPEKEEVRPPRSRKRAVLGQAIEAEIKAIRNWLKQREFRQCRRLHETRKYDTNDDPSCCDRRPCIVVRYDVSTNEPINGTWNRYEMKLPKLLEILSMSGGSVPIFETLGKSFERSNQYWTPKVRVFLCN
ncbi:MAG: hypothetical protein LAO21_22065 [Acidobacteriia bacterium]|nr:hypothetical protein [Terriglobia bacterium]